MLRATKKDIIEDLSGKETENLQLIIYNNKSRENLDIRNIRRIKKKINKIFHFYKILNHSFNIQFADHHCFHRYGKGDIIMYLGTSTAGKTTLIKCLLQEEPHRLDYSIDLFYHSAMSNIIKKQAFVPYQLLANVTNHEEISKIVVFGDKIKFRTGVTEQSKIAAEEACKFLRERKSEFKRPQFKEVFNNLLEEIIKHSIEGRPIICEVVNFDLLREFFSKNFHAPLRIILTYCPLLELSKRMERRNQQAIENQEFTNKRSFFPLLQFAELYGKKKSIDEVTLEVVTRKDVLTVFNTHAQRETDHLFKEKFMQDLGFTSPGIQQVEITPRFKNYHTYIDTSNFDQTFQNKNLSWMKEQSDKTRWEEWKKEYNQENPNSERNGYGSGALVIHRK